MPEYLTPGVYFERQDLAPPLIQRLRTDIAGFVGLAERGVLHNPVQVNSWRQFQSEFGDFVPHGFLAYTVKGFFENGGRTCFVVRVAGATAAAASLTLSARNGADLLQLTAASEGQWGDRIAVTITQVRSTPARFSLVVTRDRLEQEFFTNLSLEPDSDRYFASIINQGNERTAPSRWVSVTDLIPADQLRTSDWLPDLNASNLTRRTGSLSGGQDGLVDLTVDDFLGTTDSLAPERLGLSAFDRVDAISMVCIPDIHIQPLQLPPPAPPIPPPPVDSCTCSASEVPTAESLPPSLPEQPPKFSQVAIQTVQQALIEHCERQGDRVAILQVPVQEGSGEPFTLAEVQNWRMQFESERGFAALYHPWVEVLDPLPMAPRLTRTIPPCGHIAGLYARLDLSVGVHKAPANGKLFWVTDLTAQINDAEQGVLNPDGINCLRAFPGRGIRVYGSRTLSSRADWRYINIRRLMSMIEEAVDESTQWAVFESHTRRLRQQLILSISGFLERLWQQGALSGANPAEAFFIRCDETNNPPAVVDAGQIIAEVGVAPTFPAEFVIFRMGRTVAELEIVER
jgi:hypothetical protein